MRKKNYGTSNSSTSDLVGQKLPSNGRIIKEIKNMVIDEKKCYEINLITVRSYFKYLNNF